MSMSRPVLVVGAGLTGLTAAMELSRLEVPVRLMDQQPGPSARPRAPAVDALTAELLEQRGLRQETLRAGAAEVQRVLRERIARQDVVAEYGTELLALAQAKPDWRGEPRGSGVTALVRHRDGRLEDIAAAYLIGADDRQGAIGRLLKLRLPPPPRHGRVFFGGDCADVRSPATGPGPDSGIQDMVNLGWKLALVLREKAVPALLGTYAEERLQAIDQLERRAEAGAFLAGEVLPDYWSSPLSAPPRGPGRLQPGGRVPDMRVLTWDPAAPEGPAPRAIRLRELISPSRLNLLLTDDARRAEAPGWLERLRPWRDLIAVRLVAPVPGDEDQPGFCRVFGDGQSLVLVRPDSHVCFAGRPKTLPRLAAWLNTWFPPGPGGDAPVCGRRRPGWRHRPERAVVRPRLHGGRARPRP
jgi:hypothetical protein